MTTGATSTLATYWRVLWSLQRTHFNRSLTYRLEWLFGIVSTVLLIWTQVAIWRALLRDSGADVFGGAHVSASDMVTYIVLVNALGAHDWVTVGNQIDDRLQSGDITYDLTKPVGFPVLVLGQSLGEIFSRLLTQTLPVVVIAHLAWGLTPPASLTAAFAALATVLIGKSVAFAIGYLLGCLSFWMLSSWHYQWVVGTITKLFSGFVIPLWFMPEWLWLAPRLLPFHLLAYTPAGLYQGKIPTSEAWLLVGVGVVWTAVLWVAVVYAWRAAIRRVVVQGG